MQKAVSAMTMTSIDETSQEQYGIPGIVLMERAGARAWDILRKRISPDMSIVFLVGGGNNGGDALVMAREAFMDGLPKLLVITCGPHLSPSCAVNRNIVDRLGLSVLDLGSREPDASVAAAVQEADVVVDGLAGTGLAGPLRGTAATLVGMVASARKKKKSYVCAIDVPSGVGDTVPADALVLQADGTITMGLMKYSLLLPAFRKACGNITVVNPGFPSTLMEAASSALSVGDDEDFSLIKLDSSAYKNSRGHVAVFAGSHGYSGAANLACMAAFHARCGLVTLYTDPEVLPLIAHESPSVIARPLLEDDIPSLSLDTYGAVLAGCGWGRTDDRESILRQLLKRSVKLILDADGIHAFSSLVRKEPEWASGHCPLVLTPHPGELAALYDALPPALKQIDLQTASPQDFRDILSVMSSHYHAVLIAKSHVTWIADGFRILVVEGMDPTLGVAGSGDVLAGTCLACAVQSPSLMDASLDAVLAHRKAGRLAKDRYGWYAAEKMIGVMGHAVDMLIGTEGQTG